jgi:hypothetical protein
MPTVKITEPEKICHDSEHEPPNMMVWQPGTYKHTCPTCGKITVFTVPSNEM